MIPSPFRAAERQRRKGSYHGQAEARTAEETEEEYLKKEETERKCCIIHHGHIDHALVMNDVWFQNSNKSAVSGWVGDRV